MSQHNSIIWQVCLNGWVLIYERSGCEFESSCSHLNFKFHACFEQEVPDIQVTIECGFTLKHIRNMIRAYSQWNQYLRSGWTEFCFCHLTYFQSVTFSSKSTYCKSVTCCRHSAYFQLVTCCWHLTHWRSTTSCCCH